MRADARERLQTVRSLEGWFHESLCRAMERQSVGADESTSRYMVNLLTVFSRSENLYEKTVNGIELRSLADMYTEALSADTREERSHLLQRLGDVSLFISGFFSESLSKKLVDVDYYTRMGGTAYGTLSDQPPSTLRERALNHVFRELAEKFLDFTDVLAEVSDMARVFTEKDILRLYELWLRTGSRRALKRLREFGIEPAEGVLSDRSH